MIAIDKQSHYEVNLVAVLELLIISHRWTLPSCNIVQILFDIIKHNTTRQYLLMNIVWYDPKPLSNGCWGNIILPNLVFKMKNELQSSIFLFHDLILQYSSNYENNFGEGEFSLVDPPDLTFTLMLKAYTFFPNKHCIQKLHIRQWWDEIQSAVSLQE